MQPGRSDPSCLTQKPPSSLACLHASEAHHPCPPSCAAEKILSKEPELKADFSRAQAAVSKAKQKGVTRFPQNPGEPSCTSCTCVFNGPAAHDSRRDAQNPRVLCCEVLLAAGHLHFNRLPVTDCCSGGWAGQAV